MTGLRTSVAALGLVLVAACGNEGAKETDAPVAVEQSAPAAASEQAPLDALAARFVKLGLALGHYDKAYVDAYHGPEDWAAAIKADTPSLDALEIEATALLADLSEVSAVAEDQAPRAAMLEKNLQAALMRIQMAKGETFSFDEETRILYDATAPLYSFEEFDAALVEIEQLLPGEGTLAERVDAFRASLAIPADKLSVVFDAAIAECRKRTLVHYQLPDNERFSIGYVTDKPWSGYNWYQGDYESLIEVNTDLPVIIDRAVDLGCHEGYPGHHTWNVIMERDLVKAKGWIEYTLYPLFSPLSLIAEGSANYGIELAFPGAEKINFEREVLFPLAGLDPALAEQLATLNQARRKLSHARNAIARDYLNGDIDADQAVDLLMKYGLTSRERAEQSLRFTETYRGYVINYNLGRDLVAAYVEMRAQAGEDPWVVFEDLLRAPKTGSELARAVERAKMQQ